MSYSLHSPRKFPLEDFWKVKIVPPSTEADALVVRDYADTVSRIKIMEGDKGIWGYDAAGTWMFRLMPYDAYDAITFNTGVDFRDKMLLSGPYFTLANGKSIRTEGTATSSFLLRSHDGTAYVDCAKLVGGYLEIARGKLTGTLDCNNNDIIGVKYLKLYNETTGKQKTLAYQDASYYIRLFPANVPGCKIYICDTLDYSLKAGIKLIRGNPPHIDLGDADRVNVYLYAGPMGHVSFREAPICLKPADASSTETLKDSPEAILRGKYWDGTTSVSRDAKMLHKLLSTTPESAIDFEIAGTLCARIKDNGALAIKKVDIGDYGGNFATYSPPTGEEGMIVIAVDTNATAPGQRLYIYCNGSWRYANLT